MAGTNKGGRRTMRKFFPESVAGEGEAALKPWEAPGSDEVDKALANSGIQFGDEVQAPPAGTEQNPPPEQSPPEQKPIVEEKPPEGKLPEAAKVGDEKPPEGETQKVYTIRGVEYTEEEVDASIRNGMRQNDYTRKTQDLARERERLAEERALLDRHRQIIEQEAKRLSPDARRAGEDDPVEALLNDPEVPEAVAKAFRLERARHQAEITAMRREAQERELAVQEAALVDSALDNFESTFSDLCKKHNVTDPLVRELLHDHIVAKDPNIEDPDELRASVERIFEHSHKGLEQRAEKIRQDGIKGLTKLPAPPAAGKGGSAVPLKGESRPAATLDDGSAVPEMTERLRQLGLSS
jgi:hypothetical protein